MTRTEGDPLAKTRVTVVSVTFAAILLVVFLLYQFRSTPIDEHVQVNDGITRVQQFEVASESTDLTTAVEGTVFYGDDPTRARIVASFTIDPLDWGGVHFSFPHGWQIDEVNSSYPYGHSELEPGSGVSTATIHSEESQWSAQLMIGWGSLQDVSPQGGGRGTVLVDLSHPDGVPEQPLAFTVAVGSEIRDGYRVQGPDYIRVKLGDENGPEE